MSITIEGGVVVREGNKCILGVVDFYPLLMQYFRLSSSLLTHFG